MAAALTPSEEISLYETDREAWVRYASPRIASSLLLLNDERLAAAWSILKRDTKIKVWTQLDNKTRDRLWRIKEAALGEPYDGESNAP